MHLVICVVHHVQSVFRNKELQVFAELLNKKTHLLKDKVGRFTEILESEMRMNFCGLTISQYIKWLKAAPPLPDLFIE